MSPSSADAGRRAWATTTARARTSRSSAAYAHVAVIDSPLFALADAGS